MRTEISEIGKSLLRIRHCLEPTHRRSLWVAIIIMALAGGLTNIPPLVLGRILDRFVSENTVVFATVWPMLGLILASILLRELLQVLRKYLVENTCTKVEKDTRVRVVAHLLTLDLSFFNDKLTGALHGRMNRSIEGLIKLLKLGFLDLLPAMFIAVFSLAVVFVRAPILGLAMGMVIPIGLFIVLRQVRSQKGIRIDLLRGKEEIDGAVVELIGGLETVRALNSHQMEISRVDRISERLRKKEILHHIWMGWYDAAKFINEGIFHVVVLALAIFMASKGTISTGDILTYSMLFISVMMPLREVHRILDEAHESTLRVDDLFQLLDTDPDISFFVLPVTEVPLPRSGDESEIQVSDLVFRYDQDSPVTLSIQDMSIRRGEFVGICGPAGCGKSTFLKILLRLLHPETGRVVIQGEELKVKTRAKLANIIGYVSQNDFLASGTITENIVYGLEDINLDVVEWAAKQANIHDEIQAMNQGYNSRVGERGVTLSGGQRQRIVLARMFLRSPDILLLDEATSALDNINEAVVQRAVEKLMKGKTVISVAHRLSTLRRADRILVFKDGKIAESGAYEVLAEDDGLFADLLRTAMVNKKSDNKKDLLATV